MTRDGLTHSPAGVPRRAEAFAARVPRAGAAAPRWAALPGAGWLLDLVGHGDRFLAGLCWILLAYATIGKSVAYTFVGELWMLYGVFALAVAPGWGRVLRGVWLWPTLAFMAWGALRTGPYVGQYKIDAIRDAAVWWWGTFAVVISGLIAAEPRRLAVLDDRFRRFVKILFWTLPVVWFVSSILNNYMPNAPWAPGVPLWYVKGGDQTVHVSGAFAYAVLMGGVPEALVFLAAAFNAAIEVTGRAATVAFGIVLIAVTVLRPKGRIVMGLWGSFAAVMLFLGVTGIHLDLDATGRRDVSFEQFSSALKSLYSDTDSENMAGSKQWRLNWWHDIVAYTVHGPYFWTGKGFGVNLADDDGYQVEEDNSLRSPHNGHLCVLARAGVPGLTLWAAVQLTFAGGVAVHAYLAHRHGRRRWASFFTFMLLYWSAYMVNATFDVYLESPLGGVWMWCLYGMGIGAIWVYRHEPGVMGQGGMADERGKAVVIRD